MCDQSGEVLGSLARLMELGISLWQKEAGSQRQHRGCEGCLDARMSVRG